MNRPAPQLPEETIGDRMKIIRACLKLNQKEFAQKIGVYPVRISDIESGKRDVTLKIVSEIGKLGFDLNWFVNGKKDEGDILELIRDDVDMFKLFTNIKKLSPEHISSIANIVEGLPKK